MNKSELVQQLANRTKMSQSQSMRAVTVLFDPINGVIAHAPSATGRSATRSTASKVPAFRAGATLKNTVMGGRATK